MYGDPSDPNFGHRALVEDLAAYCRLLEYELADLKPAKRARVMDAAEEYAMAKARERHALIAEISPET